MCVGLGAKTESGTTTRFWPGTGGKGRQLPALRPTAPPERVFLQSDDVRRDFAELKARGVALLETEPEPNAYGLRATAVDPDGAFLSLRQVSPEWSSRGAHARGLKGAFSRARASGKRRDSGTVRVSISTA